MCAYLCVHRSVSLRVAVVPLCVRTYARSYAYMNGVSVCVCVRVCRKSGGSQMCSHKTFVLVTSFTFVWLQPAHEHGLHIASFVNGSIAQSRSRCWLSRFVALTRAAFERTDVSSSFAKPHYAPVHMQHPRTTSRTTFARDARARVVVR